MCFCIPHLYILGRLSICESGEEWVQPLGGLGVPLTSLWNAGAGCRAKSLLIPVRLSTSTAGRVWSAHLPDGRPSFAEACRLRGGLLWGHVTSDGSPLQRSPVLCVPPCAWGSRAWGPVRALKAGAVLVRGWQWHVEG